MRATLASFSVAAILALMVTAAPVQSASLSLPPVPQQVIETINQAPLARYGRTLKGGAHTNGGWSEGWQVAAAVAAWQGNTAVDQKLLEQIDYNLKGENSFSANGGYPSQHELTMTSTYAILSQTPRFWTKMLSVEQRQKIDLLMKACVIASAYTTSDATYAAGKVTALDGDTNLHRGWNPNFREGMFGHLLVGMVYFGGTDRVNALLNSYDHETFVAELKKAGLTNTAETFTWAQTHPDSGAPAGEKIEAAVRNYRYNGQPLQDPFALYAELTLNTYNRDVNAGLNGGEGIAYQGVQTGVIASGKEGLPNVGSKGMLTEFDSKDALGSRSSITYAYDGFRPNLANHAAVLIGGYWKDGDVADELIRRMDIGITDLQYKLEHGYRNYQKGKGSAKAFDISEAGWQPSFRTTIPFWVDVLRRHHLR